MALLKYSKQSRVSLAVAKERALVVLKDNLGHPLPAHCIADEIWLEHNMKSQGAGGAASRVLNRLKREGRAHWGVVGDRPYINWGWMLGPE